VIALADVSVCQGRFALQGVSLEIAAGQYAVLMGKTGSGKTTLLEVLCGLRPLASGRVVLLDRDVTLWRPADRGVGYVPQDRALFQTMTVRQHLAFAPVVRGWDAQSVARRVEELADLLGLGHLLDRRPRRLSGGESARVALGRALSHRPPLLLLDEPLSALDDDTRDEMIALLQTVRAQTGVTTLHVTHSLGEARRLADRLFVLKGGRIHEEPAAEGGGVLR
jgi:ABC-type sugar transport system ATPase subunit